MGALVLFAVAACSSSASPAASPAPTAPPAPAGISLAALQRLHWNALPADPLGPRELAITAWTGREFLAVGGAPITSDSAGLTGADAYDPQTGRWELLPSFPLAARDAPASAWTGHGLVVWGGSTALGSRRGLSRPLGDGAVLDVAHRRWHVMPTGPLPALTAPIAVTDSADQVIIMGGEPQQPGTSSGGTSLVNRVVASYDPATRTWRSLPNLPAVNGHDVVGLTAVRWGSRVLVAETWQHVTHPVPGATEGSGGVDIFLFDPGHGRWSRFAVPSSDSLVGADLRPLGSSLVIAGGTGCPPFAACPMELNTAFTILDAQGRARHGIAGPPIRLRAETVVGDSYVVMTGSQITGPGRDEQPGDAAGFDLATGTWLRLPSARLFKPEPESLTWTGSELIASTPTGFIALGPK